MVYRIVKQLMEQGDGATVQLPGQKPLYEMSGRGHYHFFRCRRCNMMHEVTGCEGLVDQLVPQGFTGRPRPVPLPGISRMVLRPESSWAFPIILPRF